MIDAYNDCGIVEARELIKLHREMIKTLREKYNVKPKEKERKKDKEGDDVMEDPEEVEENDNEAPIELNKTELSKYLKYIKKDKLFEYHKLYGIINGNEKLKNLITSEARCILFAPSKVKDAIKYNENMEIEEPASQQREEEPAPQQQEEKKVEVHNEEEQAEAEEHAEAVKHQEVPNENVKDIFSNLSKDGKLLDYKSLDTTKKISF